MVDMCKEYFDSIKITISTNIIVKKSKTKCIAFGLKTLTPEPIMLEGKQLPWVDSWPHLGHLLHRDESLDHDLLQKRGQFIGKLHSLKQEFGNQIPLSIPSLCLFICQAFMGATCGTYLEKVPIDYINLGT